MTPGRALLVALVALVAGACEPPLTEARRSLAMAHVFRVVTSGAGGSSDAPTRACLRTRYLAPADSAVPALLQTALRQRGVPLTEASAPTDTATAVVAVSPVRELSEALGLDVAVGRTLRSGADLRTRWTEWTFELRCDVAGCETRRRFGPRPSTREDAGPPPPTAGSEPPGPMECAAGSVVPPPDRSG